MYTVYGAVSPSAYQAIIEPSCCAETSHAVAEFIVSKLDSNVTFSIFCLWIDEWPKNTLVSADSDAVLLNAL